MIRSATLADLDTLSEIEKCCFSYDRMSRSSFKRLLGSPSSVILVDEDNGVIRGSLVLLFRRNSRIGRVYSVAVLPQYRGLGVGRRLLDAAIVQVVRDHRTMLRLEVREDNFNAIALYEQRGFRVFDRFEDYYTDGAPALRYALSLDEVS